MKNIKTKKKKISKVKLTLNGFTPAQEKRMVRETEYALKYGKSYKTVEEMFADILKN
jgi:hypothetical protein